MDCKQGGTCKAPSQQCTSKGGSNNKTCSGKANCPKGGEACKSTSNGKCTK